MNDVRLSGSGQREIRWGWLKREKERKDPEWVTGVKENRVGGVWEAEMEKHQGSCKVIEEKGLNFFSLEIKYPNGKVHKPNVQLDDLLGSEPM